MNRGKLPQDILINAAAERTPLAAIHTRRAVLFGLYMKKPIPRLPGFFASEDGTIWKGSRRCFQSHTVKGYLRIQIRNGNRRICYKVHRLILEAFVGPQPIGTTVFEICDGELQRRTPTTKKVTEPLLLASAMGGRKWPRLENRYFLAVIWEKSITSTNPPSLR